MEYISNNPTQCQPGRLRRVPGFYHHILKEKKNVHFAAGRDLERVKIFDTTKAVVTHHESEERLPIDKVPLLFKCKSGDEIIHLVESGRAEVSEIYRGHNALHWYCNAKSTSPSLIETLVRYGIDINAVDQCVVSSHHNPVMMRHTALGLACRNANVKAVHTLLRLGASPFGLDRAAQPKRDAGTGKRLLYPSPLQVLLCQPIHGPRPACPWTYHLGERDEEGLSAYLDEDRDALPHFRPLLARAPPGEGQQPPVCADCTRGFHIWEPWPASERDAAAWRAHRRRCWHTQVRRVGARLQRCAQLLVDYGGPLRRGDDPHLWTALEFLLETAWRFLGPAAVCWRDEGGEDVDVSSRWGRLVGVPTEIAFPPFGEICDLLLESAGYGDDEEAESPAMQARGQQRLVALIAQHPDFERFKEGEFFDIDAELKSQQAEDALSRAATT
ncbi:hypothetical protein F4809DRAFT_649233 [Biscogniauxia mediterranea]|nr:hypothetical protein F4809DRAFT_649233 [Biscogniauxia mediterranea]